ncbi:dCTP deaminase [Robertmurraya sp. P23]|uniref:dCTP deaminase n=1 Tax=Robertmurraya sp. P23 TaxID=3436931 RepID=UPI003D981DD0
MAIQNTVVEDENTKALSWRVSGMLSDHDIKNCIEKDEIFIYPYHEKNLTPVGYNLTPSDFILSINNQLLVKIHNNNDEKYCYIEPNDTVLIMTREAVKVPNNVAGTFHSKVGVVSKGFGHISTTLDPLWQGPLLISMNNPTNRRIKLLLAKVEKGEGKGELTFQNSSFVTLMFSRMISPASGYHDNPSGRFDILKKVVEKPNRKRIFRVGKNYSHYLQLKDMIDTIGSIEFIKYEIPESKSSITKEQFKTNYEKFYETLNFYTDQAHDTSRKIISIKNAWINTWIIIKSLVPIIAIMYFAWDFSNGGQIDGKVGLVALLIALLPWASQLRELKKEK